MQRKSRPRKVRRVCSPVDRSSIRIAAAQKDIGVKRGRSLEDFIDVLAEEEDTHTHRAMKRANRKR